MGTRRFVAPRRKKSLRAPPTPAPVRPRDARVVVGVARLGSIRLGSIRASARALVPPRAQRHPSTANVEDAHVRGGVLAAACVRTLRDAPLRRRRLRERGAQREVLRAVGRDRRDARRRPGRPVCPEPDGWIARVRVDARGAKRARDDRDGRVRERRLRAETEQGLRERSGGVRGSARRVTRLCHGDKRGDSVQMVRRAHARARRRCHRLERAWRRAAERQDAPRTRGQPEERHERRRRRRRTRRRHREGFSRRGPFVSVVNLRQGFLERLHGPPGAHAAH